MIIPKIENLIREAVYITLLYHTEEKRESKDIVSIASTVLKKLKSTNLWAKYKEIEGGK